MLSNYEVLYIEDDQEDFEILKEEAQHMLLNVNITRAPSLQEGLELIKDRVFDLILLDLGLPGLGDRCEGMKKVTEATETPIVVMSGLVTDNMLQDIYMNHRALTVVDKPLVDHQFQSILQGI